MPNLFGTAPNQAPTNGDLGTLAFQDANAVKITGGEVTAVQKTDTAISETNPSLNLDFANTKSLDPRITFTRNTTATFYDGKTVAKAEENLLTYSEQFDNAVWIKSASTVVANATTAPDGTIGADKIISTGSNGLVYQSVASSTSLGNNAQIVSLVDGALGSVIVGSFDSISTTLIGNGFYRIAAAKSGYVFSVYAKAAEWGYIHVQMQYTSNTVRFYIYPAQSSSSVGTGDGTSGIFIWGAQLEQRSAVSSYTPTTSSPVTNYIPALQTCPVNSARFDHDPVTGESKGLLIEEQRTNLLTYSEQFDNGIWVLVAGSRTSNANIAPDGTLTADQLTTSGIQSQIVQGLTIPSGATVTASCYFKQYGLTLPALVLLSNNNTTPYASATFDISTGTISVAAAAFNGGTSPTASITSVGNGWYRCSLTVTYPAVTAAGLRISAAGASGSLFLWGAQLEAGAFPTSYIPTTDQQKTRSADAASITGTNFSSWYRQDEGTLYVEAIPNQIMQSGRLWCIDDGSTSNQIDVTTSANQVGLEGVTNGSFVGSIGGTGTISINMVFKVASTLSTTAVKAISLNGASAVAGALNLTSNVTTLRFGRQSNAAVINGTIKRLTYFPKRLSNDELVEMTS